MVNGRTNIRSVNIVLAALALAAFWCPAWRALRGADWLGIVVFGLALLAVVRWCGLRRDR